MNLKLIKVSGGSIKWLCCSVLSVLLLSSYPLSAQNAAEASCTVLVKDSDDRPLPGVSVLIKGSQNGEISGTDGVCTLKNVPANAVIVASMMGMETAQVPVGGRARIEIVLNESSLLMKELVVVGYGVQRKRDLTGSVASVKGDVINEFANVSVANALQGRISGVQVNQTNGQPGAGIQVRIRGANSIKGDNEPLWIINGFPGDMNMINTSDIESIEVLKDASATAIYGSRGANGVIIVTTKGAKGSQVKLSYEGSVGVQTLAKQMQMLDGPEYMHYLNQKAAVNNQPMVFTEQQIADNIWSTNWQDEVFQTALVNSHAVDISGGNAKVKGSLGLSYFDQEGIVQNSGYKRLSIRSNLKYDLSKYVSASANIIFSRSDHDQMNSQGGSRGTSVINAAMTASPLATPKYDDGSWNDFQTQPTTGVNPVAYLNEIKNAWYANRLLANAELTLRPLDGLTLQFSGNVSNKETRKDYTKSKAYPQYDGAASISFGETVAITSNNIATYVKDWGRHHLTLMAGMTYEDSTTKSVATGTASGFLSDVVESYDLDAADIKGLPTSGYSHWALLSYLGRINYNFDDRYLLTVNFRADGSSRYSKGNKWGYFPSAAFAWRVSEESFMREVRQVSQLKFRLGYGVTGSTAIAPYATSNTLSSQNVVFDKETVVAYAPLNTYLGDLRWETTAQFNAGIDLGLWADRIRLTADYYYKKTTDLLNDVEMPRSSGYTTSLSNIGSVSNRGFEFQLDGRVIDREFKWDLGVNFSMNRSKVLALSEDKDIFGPTVSNVIVSDKLNLMRVGQPMFLFYGYVEKGYDERGQLLYEDLDGDESVTAADKRIIGDPNPDFLLNFSTSFAYKRLSLSAFFQGSFGNDLYSMSMASMAYDYSSNANTLRDVYYNHWTPENPNAKYPNLLQNIALKMSDRFVYDGTYLRLKNIELAYDLPLGRFAQKALIYLSAQNLLTLTQYPFWDPDVNYNGGGSSLAQGVDEACYPSARTFTLGCRITF